MLSRIADSLFWLARYIERAEDTARILDVTFHTLLEEGQQGFGLRWDPILSMAGEEALFRQMYGDANAQNVFEFLAFSPHNPSSIMQCITKARENARTIRDRISREMWEDLNGLYFTLGGFEPREEIVAGPHRFCARTIFGSHRFHGVADATLPHDEGWEFLRIGFSLERAEMTARLVDVQYRNLLGASTETSPPDNHRWMALLKSVGAYEAYHRQYHAPIEPARVAEMLVLHAQHPRSIRFSATEIQSGLRAVSKTSAGSYANEAERLTGKVLERLRYDRIDEILRNGLHAYLTDLIHMFNSIGDSIARSYFYYYAIPA
jgi:uncharacterized alpha-E superfamily protein